MESRLLPLATSTYFATARATLSELEEVLRKIEIGASITELWLERELELLRELGGSLDDYWATFPIKAGSTRAEAEDLMVQHQLSSGRGGGEHSGHLRADSDSGDPGGRSRRLHGAEDVAGSYAEAIYPEREPGRIVRGTRGADVDIDSAPESDH